MKSKSGPTVLTRKKSAGGILDTIKTIVYAVLIALVQGAFRGVPEEGLEALVQANHVLDAGRQLLRWACREQNACTRVFQRVTELSIRVACVERDEHVTSRGHSQV